MQNVLIYKKQSSEPSWNFIKIYLKSNNECEFKFWEFYYRCICVQIIIAYDSLISLKSCTLLPAQRKPSDWSNKYLRNLWNFQFAFRQPHIPQIPNCWNFYPSPLESGWKRLWCRCCCCFAFSSSEICFKCRENWNSKQFDEIFVRWSFGEWTKFL